MPYRPTGRPPGRPSKAPPEIGTKPDLPAWVWDALALEFAKLDLGREPWPSTARAQDIADKVGVCRRAIERRRSEDPMYRRGLDWLLVEHISDEVCARLDAAEAAEPAEPVDKFAAWERLWHGQTPKWRRDQIRSWAWRYWPKSGAGVKSMADGKVYRDPESYAEHLIESGFMPWPAQMPWPAPMRTKK